MAEINNKLRKDDFIVTDLSDLFKPISTNDQIITYCPYEWQRLVTCTEIVEDYEEPTAQSITSNIATLRLNDASSISINDTLIVQGIYGYNESGTMPSREEAVLYITDIDYNSNEVQCYCINGKKIGNFYQCVPSIEEGTIIIYAGKASDNIHLYPNTLTPISDAVQYTQQFEYSFYEDKSKIKGKIINYNNFSNTELVEIRRFISRKNTSYLLGVKGLDDQPKTMRGIWKQAGKEFVYNSQGLLDSNSYIDMARKAFSGIHNNSKKKFILAGSELAGTFGKSGVFNEKYEYNSPFGTLRYFYYPILDDAGMSGNGIIIDPEYINIYVKSPLKGTFDSANGIMTFTEESTVILKNTKSHMRIVKV